MTVARQQRVVLEGESILGILHPVDHQSFVQTASALLAMVAGSPGVVTPPQSVRALHRVFFRRSGQASEVMVDTIITAKRPNRRVLSHQAQTPEHSVLWRHGLSAAPPHLHALVMNERGVKTERNRASPF